VTGLTDHLEQTVVRAQRGDRAAFGQLVATYQSAVRGVARQILGDVHDAEDAVQETWLAAMRRIETLRDPACFGSWLYRIAANVALRKRQQRVALTNHERGAEASLRLCASEMPDDASTAPDVGRGTTATEQLPWAMDALSSKDRLATVLHYCSGMRVTEIAALLEVPAGTVKSRLHRARETMRKEIQTMAQKEKRQEHVPPSFRATICNDEGELPWHDLLREGFSDWSIAHIGQGYEPLGADARPEHWAVAGDGFVGETAEAGSCMAAGAGSWRDYEVSLLITPIKGGNAQVLFRMDEKARRWYLFDMMLGWQAAAVAKVEQDAGGDPVLTRLSVVNYPVEVQRQYAISVAARGGSLTTYIDGALVNQVTDLSLPAGRIGLNVWQAKTLYRDIRLCLMAC